MATDELPDELHHYFNLKFGKSMLESGKLYLSSFQKFNDVFELLPALKKFDYTHLSEQDLGEEFLQIAKTDDGLDFFGSMGLSEIAASTTMALNNSMAITPTTAIITLAGVALYNLFRSNSKKAERERLLLFLKDFYPLRDSIKGCCFCSDDRNVLMWSHYADKHRGIVISYDMTKAFWKDAQIRKMVYSDERVPLPQKDYISREYIWELLTRKATCWEYEQEWRLFKFNMKNKRKIPIAPECVKAVKMGCRVSGKEREKIRDICKRNYPNAKLYVEKISSTKFEIEFEKLNKLYY